MNIWLRTGATVVLLAACSDYDVASRAGAPVAGDDTGSPWAPDIEVSPAIADFGTVARGEVGTGSLTVQNVGDATLNLDSVRLSDTTGAFTDGVAARGADPRSALGRSRPVRVRHAPRW